MSSSETVRLTRVKHVILTVPLWFDLQNLKTDWKIRLNIQLLLFYICICRYCSERYKFMFKQKSKERHQEEFSIKFLIPTVRRRINECLGPGKDECLLGESLM